MVDAVDRYLGLPVSDLPGMLAPTGHHDQHSRTAGIDAPATSPAATQEV